MSAYWFPWIVFAFLAAACQEPTKVNPSPSASVLPTALAQAGSASGSASRTKVVASVTSQRGSFRVERVVLLTIDALRGDQPWTGYEHASTPHLSKLADKSAVYTRAYSPANTTGPSISSLLAARYPTELDRDNCPLAGFHVGEGIGPILKAGGVWTAAAHGHAYFGASTAPRGGFVDWRTVKDVAGKLATEGAVTGPEVTELVLSLLKSAPVGKPSFIWAHYLEPHDKYVYHRGFAPSNQPRRGVYDGEVAFVDDLVGKVLGAIEASELRDRTAIIVSADHGEAFGEHQRYRHGFTVFEEEVRIPLIVYVPGLKPRRIETPRSTLDLPRTIVELLGVAAPSRWRGKSLLRDFETNEPELRPVIVDVPELMNLPAQQAVVVGQHKVIRFGNRWSVYDLKADPGEKKKLSQKDSAAMINKAKAALATIETVKHRGCKRKPYRD